MLPPHIHCLNDISIFSPPQISIPEKCGKHLQRILKYVDTTSTVARPHNFHPSQQLSSCWKKSGAAPCLVSGDKLCGLAATDLQRKVFKYSTQPSIWQLPLMAAFRSYLHRTSRSPQTRSCLSRKVPPPWSVSWGYFWRSKSSRMQRDLVYL